jgi:penicillin-binding protein 1A
MQPREQPRERIGESPRAAIIPLFGQNQTSGGADPDTLTARELLRLLGKRILESTRAHIGHIKHLLLQLRSRLRTRLRSSAGQTLTRISAFLRHVPEFPTNLIVRFLHALPLTLVRQRWRVGLAVLVVFVPASYFAYCIVTIPFSGGLSIEPTPSALVVEADDGRAFATRGIFKGEKLSPDQLPAILAGAVIAIEDRRFYQHGGIDFPATIRAAWHDLLGRRLEGGSTITQQLARLLYLSPERSLKRKVQEVVLAIWLESHLTKQQILARYLDTAYFGAGAYGVDAAAKRYFGKSAKDLSVGEAAMLAGLIRAPSALEPDRNLDRARQRENIVLDAMVQAGTISQQQADDARQKPTVLHVPPQAPTGTNYFIDTMASEVKSLVGTNVGDLTVRTTLNRELQQIAESVIAKRLATTGASKNAHQAALIAMAPDGAILAMVGGRDYNNSQFNRAIQARRQPGSLFKLFVYLAAMRKGLTPETVLVDQPVQIGDWEPENYGDRYYGPVNLRTAFAHSLNSIAVQLADRVGVRSVIETAKQLGVQSNLPEVPSVALGSGDVTLLEMTRAFAAIAKDTNRVDQYTVNGITKANRNLYSRSAPHATQADGPLLHSEMMDLLSSVVRDGTGRAAQLDLPVAGKTGTSQDYRDAWFVGFTPDLVVGVWVGNDDNSPMKGVTGGSLPATIWHDFVKSAEPLWRSQGATAGLDGTKVATSMGSAPEASANADDKVLRGTATVLDSGVIELQGRVIRLLGWDSFGRRDFYALCRLLRRREVICTPAGRSPLYNCQVGDINLSASIIAAGQFANDASRELERVDKFAHINENLRRHASRHFWVHRFFHW